MKWRDPFYVECANCGKPIRRPTAGSYPESVEWVHVLSPLGEGNRYCNTSGSVAQRAAS